MSINFEKLNQELKDRSPFEIVDWALSLNKYSIVTTNFGPNEAVILHMLTQVKPEIHVIWIDSGYNTKKTYAFAELLIQQFNLNIDVFTPKVTVARRETVFGGVPTVDSPEHKIFTEQFKLEPFNRAMREYQPELWFTAVRREQTAFRQDMDIVSQGPQDCIKVAPLLDWTENQMQAYRNKHNLPNEDNYYDPTKALANRECGLHTMAKSA